MGETHNRYQCKVNGQLFPFCIVWNDWWLGRWKEIAMRSFFVQKSRVDGWVGRRMEGKAGLRIACSNQKVEKTLGESCLTTLG